MREKDGTEPSQHWMLQRRLVNAELRLSAHAAICRVDAALSGRWVLELQDLRLRIVELGLGLIGGVRVRVRKTG